MSSLLKSRRLNLYFSLKYPRVKSLLSSQQTVSRAHCSLANCSSLLWKCKHSIGLSFGQCRGQKITAGRDPCEKQAALSSEPFLDGTSATYIDEMYEAYQKDHSSVHTVPSQILISLYFLIWLVCGQGLSQFVANGVQLWGTLTNFKQNVCYFKTFSAPCGNRSAILFKLLV